MSIFRRSAVSRSTPALLGGRAASFRWSGRGHLSSLVCKAHQSVVVADIKVIFPERNSEWPGQAGCEGFFGFGDTVVIRIAQDGDFAIRHGFGDEDVTIRSQRHKTGHLQVLGKE